MQPLAVAAVPYDFSMADLHLMLKVPATGPSQVLVQAGYVTSPQSSILSSGRYVVSGQ